MDEQARLRIKQELCELYLSGAHGIVCAPMPGTMLEMLEIAAMERRSAAMNFAHGHGATEPLTPKRDRSLMSACMAPIGRALRYVAIRFGRGDQPGRVPA